jgi:hypothetical protein
MAESITDRLKRDRFTIVEILADRGQVRLKGPGGRCRDLACGADTVVEASEGPTGGLTALNPGDIVRIEPRSDGGRRVVVVRRVWDELSSPEF